MAAWDHADLLSLPAKALLYPNYCDDDEIRRSISYLQNLGYHSMGNKKANMKADKQAIVELQTELAKRRDKRNGGKKKWES